MQDLMIDPCSLPPDCEQLRLEVRAFLSTEMKAVLPSARNRSWVGVDRGFSRRMGAAGWIGMTWPRRYGGGERSALERYVVLEEVLAVGAPVGAHWTGDRQSGPLLLRFAPDTLAPRYLPRMARGELIFCVGMSEPGSGSDLSAVRTRAKRTDEGWVINGRKLWTSFGHFADYMIAFVRTGDGSGDRHAGFSQFLVDMRSDGITASPIIDQLGESDFSEITFEDVLVPHDHLIGEEGDGWAQVMTELSYERSGPERYLSSTPLLLEMLNVADPADARHTEAIGRLVAHYGTLRQMSIGVAGMLARGENPALAAALVKDQGSLVEDAIPDVSSQLFAENAEAGSILAESMRYFTLASPSFSLRGGTREILRSIIARGMGLR